MARVSEEERKFFHDMVDLVVDSKLHSEKNINKTHWSNLPNAELSKMQIVEANELEHAVLFERDIISECLDNIALPLFILHNLYTNKGKKSEDVKDS